MPRRRARASASPVRRRGRGSRRRGAERADERVVQGRRLDRLGQERARPLRRRSRLAERRQDDEQRPRRRRAPGLPRASAMPSISGILQVEHDDVERRPALDRSAAPRAAMQSRGDRMPSAPAGDEDPPVGRRCRRRPAPAGPRGRPARRAMRRPRVRRRPPRARSRVEGAALARHAALGPERAAHQLREPAADREAQARAAEPPRDRRSAWLNDWNSRLDPLRPGCRCRCRRPRSATPRRRAPVARLRRAGRHRDATSPRSVNLTAFDSRLSMIWRSRPGRRRRRRQLRRRSRRPAPALVAAACGPSTSSAPSTPAREVERAPRRARTGRPRSSRSPGCR